MKHSPIFKVIIAILLAIAAGIATGAEMTLFGVPFVKMYGFIGQLFLNALSLIVVPLVAASIITGMSKMGSDRSFGALGLKTFGYFIFTSSIAILIGLAVMALYTAIAGSDSSLAPTLNASATVGRQQAVHTEPASLFDSSMQIFLKIVPPNILAAAAQGQMIGLIFFCMLFGFFASRIDSHLSVVVVDFWRGIFQIMMKITHLIMKALPIGVFGLVAKAIAVVGLDTLSAVATFLGLVLCGLAIYAFVLLPLLLKVVGRVSPSAHFKAMMPALVTAFSTSSSAATLPVSLECIEKRAGVSNRIGSFVLPLGSSVNLSGSSLYVCASVLFIAHAYGVHLPLASILLVVLMTFLTSLGTAGIPSASMISVMLIMQTIGIPSDGIALIMAVERILDMFRTTVNVFGTSCCAVLVARSEGEVGVLAQQTGNNTGQAAGSLLHE